MTRFLDLDSADDRQVLTSLVRQMLDKAATEQPGVDLEFATVTAHGINPDQTFAETQVQLAGAAEDEQTPVVNLLPSRPQPGDRVGVLRVPPFGLYAVGTTNERAAACGAVHATWYDPLAAGIDGYERLPLLEYDRDEDWSDGRAALACGFGLVDGDDDGYLDSVVIPSPGVYLASASCRFTDPGEWQIEDRLYFGIRCEFSPGGDVLQVGDSVFQVADVSANYQEEWVHVCAAQVFYAPAGAEVYGVGFTDRFTPPGPNALFGNADGTTHGLSIVPLCCDFAPQEPIDPTPT